MGGRRAQRPAEIEVTLTALAPGTEREREAVLEARRIWWDAQLAGAARQVEPPRTGRPGAGGAPAPPT